MENFLHLSQKSANLDSKAQFSSVAINQSITELKRRLVRRKWQKKDDSSKKIVFMKEDVTKIIGILRKR